MKTKKQIPPAPPLSKGGTARAFVKGQIAPSQVKALHATIHQLGIDDENYRHMLHSRYGVTTCKDLSWRQAEELLAHLNGNQPPAGGGACSPPRLGGAGGGRGLKYQDLDSRPGFASGSQLRLIDAMWHQVTRLEDEESIEKALNTFINRIAHVAGIRMLKGWQVEKVVRALEGMGAVIKRTTEVKP